MVHLSTTAKERDIDSEKLFGRYGVGTITGHPAGLLVVAAVLFLTLESIPESRWFVAAALVAGGTVGFFLWLRHR
jgi:hypothetical protein